MQEGWAMTALRRALGDLVARHLPARARALLFPPRYPAGAAAQLYCERRRRQKWFGARGFWEPSWDILLYLFDAWETGVVSVAAGQLGCLGIAVSSDSIERWLLALAAQEYVELSGDAEQLRVRLSAHGVATMARYLEEGSRVAYPLAGYAVD